MGTFIDRDETGQIIGSYFCRQRDGQEEVANGHPQLVAFQRAREQARANRSQALRDEVDAARTVDELKAILKKVVG